MVPVLVIILSVVALLEVGGFNKPLVYVTGACGITGTSALNATLHIVINIISTAILASSNMFMQVLNAPSRERLIGVMQGARGLRSVSFLDATSFDFPHSK